MGGCRCTYKNCTVRSDGKTHLFHYPVFDKIRCHEWITNAGRYDFLNLKVSQLKNRCICQHHFTDDWFMNDNKEKLKLKAVPTLDGPYCDSSKFKDTEMPQSMLGLYPIACELIETDDFILDRKSNYNIVYADFLTNCETMEPTKDCSKNTRAIQYTKNWTNIENVTPATNNNMPVVGYKLRNADTVSKPRLNNKFKHKTITPNPPPSVVALEFEIPPLSVEQKNAVSAKQVKVEIPLERHNDNVGKTIDFPSTQKTKSKVRIISEKKIIEPEKKISVPISAAAFEVVKPSMILNINKNKAKSKASDVVKVAQSNKVKEDLPMLHNVDKSMINEIIVTSGNEKENPVMLNNLVSNPLQEVENITELLATNDPSKYEIKINLNEKNLQEKPTRNQVIATKHKMSPERAAAINEKRKFNMKLKDIIAAELNRLEEQSLVDKDTLVPKKKKIYHNKRAETVLSSLSKEPSLPNEHAYIVHYLEARMEKMENLLLNKIDQNTKNILDLKRSFEASEEKVSASKSLLKKSRSSEQAQKKRLYEEISKYLTPNSNSLIYEELFINKYNPNELDDDASSKRRRIR